MVYYENTVVVVEELYGRNVKVIHIFPPIKYMISLVRKKINNSLMRLLRTNGFKLTKYYGMNTNRGIH